MKSVSKINLHLKVTGKRPNGYHELESLFLPLNSPADDIHIQEASNGQLSITSNDETIPKDDSNICWKAVDQFAKFAKNEKSVEISTSWHIDIQKQIPVAAGMGGGSSNAAVVLNFLNSHDQLFNHQELVQIATSIGADVPFFLTPQPSIVHGIGEIITPAEINAADLPLVIIAPMFPVSAKWCYQHLNLKETATGKTSKINEIISAFQQKDWQKVGNLIENDLAQPVFAKFPIMEIICQKLAAYNTIKTLMSGSGPTLFTICPNHDAAKHLQQQLEHELPDEMRIFTTAPEPSGD